MSSKRRTPRTSSKPAPAPEPPPATPPFAVRAAIVAALLLAFFALVLGDIYSTSETIDEPTHLAAGYMYLTAHDYRLNPEHPPLLKMVAALPLLGRVWPPDFRTPEVADVHKGGTAIRLLAQEWGLSLLDQVPHYSFGHHLLYPWSDAALARHGVGDPHDIRGTADVERSDYLNDPESLFRSARTVAALFGLLLGAIVFAWAYELFGWRGGVFALVLFAFEPNFIAHSGLVTTDLAVSAFFVATIYFLWRASRSLTIGNVLGFALAFALAMTSKFSAMLLLPIVGVLLLRQIVMTRKLAPAALLAVATGAVTFATIWTVYGFRYDSVPDPAREAIGESASLSQATRMDIVMRANALPVDGHPPLEDRVQQTAAFASLRERYPELPPLGALRAAQKSASPDFIGRTILFAARHHLLPEAYLYGFAYLRTSSFYRNAYLNGEYSNRGFGDYFFWTTLYKTPIPTLIAIVLALFVVVRRRGDRAFLLVPPLIYIGVAIGSAIDIGHRHLLPAMAFLLIACGAIAPKRRLIAVCAIVALATLFVFAPPWHPAPMFGHHLSYFNELAGGPRNGYEHLADSNLDWGQDLPALREWLDANHVAEPVTLVYFGDADPRFRGIRHRNMGIFAYEPQDGPPIGDNGSKYVAISTNMYVGVLDKATRNAWRERLAGATLVGRAGYSILIYRLAS